MNTEPTTPPFGVNLYGHLTSHVGLGVSARNTLRMLVANEIPVRTVDLPLPVATDSDLEVARIVAENAEAGPFSINLFHINPDTLRRLISPDSRERLELEGRLNVCVPFWETERVPRSWLPTLSAMDVVLAPSTFVGAAVLADLPGARVLPFPQAVFLPDAVAPNRARFGLPSDKLVFAASFMPASGVERKDPSGMIEAFGRAFPDGTRAVLALRIGEASATHAGTVRVLRELAAATPGVVLIEGPLDYAGVLALYASADALVSLHRSEGLGLNIMEAMTLGVPVIATAWSGNMDFTTPETAALVRADLVPIDVPHSSPYHASQTGVAGRWAQPDLDDAARWMRRIADEPDLRARLSATGRERMKAARETFMAGEIVGRLAEASAQLERNPGRAARFEALRRGHRGVMARYVLAGVVRRLRRAIGR